MKLTIFLSLLVALAAVHQSNEFFLAALGIASSIIGVATKTVGLIKETKATVDLFKGSKDNAAVSKEMLNTMNSLHDKQMKQNEENYINTMLKLNGIEGKFDGLSSQVTDMQGHLVDISFMLDGMDGKLDSIADLVQNIDGKMDKFSNQVI